MTRRVQFAADLLFLVAAFGVAYLLRFDFRVPAANIKFAAHQLPYVVIIQFVALLGTGAYSILWRYIGISELRIFLKAALYSATPLLLLRLGLPVTLSAWKVPLSVIIIDTGIAFTGLLALRILGRVLYESAEQRKESASGRRTPVLLVGAGSAGAMAAKEIQVRARKELDIRGFVDDDPSKVGSSLHGVKVLGTTADIPRLAREHQIGRAIITIVEGSRDELRRILEICESVQLPVRIVPGLHEILRGRVSISRIREVQIEDLLGREQVHLDEGSLRSFLTGRRVMVTGAGGSIGSELARQVARFEPSNLLLVERAEFALFDIDRELRREHNEASPVPIVADIGDASRMRGVMAEYRPHVILHAAAHKHVPMMEANPSEAIKNNVLGTRTLGELAAEFGTEVFVLISTDKAVRPTSVMGASKRLAELVVQDLHRKTATRFVAVRFGNVLGSAGSVIPIFREQIERGGPVTVTHPEMTRYFMTIPEASQLVIQTGAMGHGGEICILDMGEPVKIVDLARDMITLSGFRPGEEIEIVYSGVRPGEKLYEELQTVGENIAKTRHPKIFIGQLSGLSGDRLAQGLTRLKRLAESCDGPAIRQCIADLLPESATGLRDAATEPQEPPAD